MIHAWPLALFVVLFFVFLSAFRQADQENAGRKSKDSPAKSAALLAAMVVGVAWAAIVGLGFGPGQDTPEGCGGVIYRGGMDATC